MEINLVALMITIAAFMLGFILGIVVGKSDDNFRGYNI